MHPIDPKGIAYTVEPRYNEGPRYWENLFAITRFGYLVAIFHIIYYFWGKENRSLYRRLRYIEARKSPLFCRPSEKKNATFVTRRPPENCLVDNKPSRAA